MCDWGATVNLRVRIPAESSHTGAARWDTKAIDRCLVPLVQALNDAGLYTAGCCCGHGKEGQRAFIGLHDGTMLNIEHLLDTAAARCGSGVEPQWVPGPAVEARGG